MIEKRRRLGKIFVLAIFFSLTCAIPVNAQSPTSPTSAPSVTTTKPKVINTQPSVTTTQPPVTQTIKPTIIEKAVNPLTTPGAIAKPPIVPSGEGTTFKATINTKIQKTIRRTPITYKPFTLEELKRLAPTVFPRSATIDTVVTLPPFREIQPSTAKIQPSTAPTRRVAKVSDILFQLNNFEKKFNAMGYTVRKRQKIQIGGLIKDTNVLKEQQENVRGIGPFKSQRGLASAEYVGNQFEQANTLPLKFRKSEPLDPDKNEGHKLFVPLYYQNYRSFPAGDPDIIFGVLNTGYSIRGDQNAMTFNASGKVNCSLFGKMFSLFEVEAQNWSVPSVDRNKASKTFTKMLIASQDVSSILPVQIRNMENTNINLTAFDISRAIPPIKVETTVQVGPVPVTVRVWVDGSVGLKSNLTLSSGGTGTTNWTEWPKMEMSVSPYLDTWVNASAGVGGYHVASVGIGGALRMFKDTVTLGGGLFAKTAPSTPQGELYFEAGLYGTNETQALDGSLWVYLSIGAGVDAEFTYDIFTWVGYTFPKQDLFRLPVFTYYPMKDKMLTIQYIGFTRPTTDSIPAPPGSNCVRSHQGIITQVWEKGKNPGAGGMDEFGDVVAGYSMCYSNGARCADLVYYTPWNQTVTAPTPNTVGTIGGGDGYHISYPYEIEIPVNSKDSPYTARIALYEIDNCTVSFPSPQNFQLSYIADITAQTTDNDQPQKVLMVTYDVNLHQFRGWSASSAPPPYLSNFVPRGTTADSMSAMPSNLRQQIGNPHFYFTLRDRYLTPSDLN